MMPRTRLLDKDCRCLRRVAVMEADPQACFKRD